MLFVEAAAEGHQTSSSPVRIAEEFPTGKQVQLELINVGDLYGFCMLFVRQQSRFLPRKRLCEWTPLCVGFSTLALLYNCERTAS